MANLIEATGISRFLNPEHAKVDNFEAFYSDLVTSGNNEKLIAELDEIVRTYFSGLQIPDQPTVYDYLLLCLRDKDVIPPSIGILCWPGPAHERNINIKRLPRILYLHGTVGIGLCREHHMMGFVWQNCIKCNKKLIPPPLLFPVKEKDYSKDKFIADQWSLLEAYLKMPIGSLFLDIVPQNRCRCAPPNAERVEQKQCKRFCATRSDRYKNKDRTKEDLARFHCPRELWFL
jgi:hypothetical protein